MTATTVTRDKPSLVLRLRDSLSRHAQAPAVALDGSDALVIITDWKEFKSPDFDAIKSRLKQAVVIDGRNLYEPALLTALGIEYVGIGRSNRGAAASAPHLPE